MELATMLVVGQGSGVAALGKMDSHGVTDRGLARDVNEDQFLIADLRKSLQIHETSLSADDHSWLYGGTQGQLLLVADGIGGHEAGERASTIAVDCIAHFALHAMQWCFRLDEPNDEDVLAQWKKALGECETRVQAESHANPRRRGMGTTLTLAYVIWPRLYVVHAGDSRCYLFRQSQLNQVTTDHTVAQKYVDAGLLTAQQAEHSRYSHVLWNAIGGSSDALSPEVHKGQLAIGDTLLLCTDGLTNHVSDRQIATVLEEGLPAREACQRLVEAANQGGGSDNITVVVARFIDQDSMAAGASAALAETRDFPAQGSCAGGPARQDADPDLQSSSIA